MATDTPPPPQLISIFVGVSYDDNCKNNDNCKNDNCKTKILTTTVKKVFFTVVVVLIIENICTVVVKVTLFGQCQL